MSVIIDHQ